MQPANHVVRPYTESDLNAMLPIWNRVVRDAAAFPQTEELGREDARNFFAAQTLTAVTLKRAVITGLYILHPNNLGRCSHIANASYAVSPCWRGQGFGETMVRHSLQAAREHGFRLMQFNAVVKTNEAAIHIYEKIGFVRLGIIPGGFLLGNGHYEDILLYYYKL